jgi:hypothetical protein
MLVASWARVRVCAAHATRRRRTGFQLPASAPVRATHWRTEMRSPALRSKADLAFRSMNFRVRPESRLLSPQVQRSRAEEIAPSSKGRPTHEVARPDPCAPQWAIRTWGWLINPIRPILRLIRTSAQESTKRHLLFPDTRSLAARAATIGNRRCRVKKVNSMAAERRIWRQIGAAVIASAVWVGLSVLSSKATAQDDTSRFGYVRLHCTSDNESHFTDVAAELTKENFAPPAAPIAIGGNRTSSRSFIAGFEAHWGAGDLKAQLNHPAPAVQLLSVLRGVFSITVTDGETRQLHSGDVVLLEDIAPCRGHITVVGDQPGFLLFAR